MASEIDELTVNYSEDGQQLVKELDKIVLSKGAWATVIYRYQDWEAPKSAFSQDKFTIRRYQKRNGEYFQKSKFNISSIDQAQKIIEALQAWIGPAAAAAPAAAPKKSRKAANSVKPEE